MATRSIVTGFDSYRNREPGWLLEMMRDEWRSRRKKSTMAQKLFFATGQFSPTRARREIAKTLAQIEREAEEKSRGSN